MKETKELTNPITPIAIPGWDDDITSGLTPGKLSRIIKSAKTGDASEYLTLAEEMEERDLHYRSVLSTRKHALEGLPLKIKANDKIKPAVIESVEQNILGHPDIRDLIKDSLDAIGKGFSAHEILWETSESLWKPVQFIWRDPRVFQYTKKGNLLLKKEGNETEELSPYKFIVHSPRLKTGLPIRSGLALPVSFYFLIKYYDVTSWAAFVDRYGFPIRIGKYGKNASDKDKEVLKKAISRIGQDVGAIIPENMLIELIESKTSGASSAIYEKLASWADSQISKGVLGQTMTADNGSSQSQANVHNEVRHDILEADGRQLEKTITRDVIIPFVDLNFGRQDIYPSIDIHTPDQDDLNSWTDNVGKMIDRGLPVRAEEIRQKLGLSSPAKGDEVIGGVAASPVSKEKNFSSGTLEMNTAEDRIQDPEEEFEDDFTEITEEMNTAIEKVMSRSKNLQEFKENLVDIIPEWNIEKTAMRMAVAFWLARAEGDDQI